MKKLIRLVTAFILFSVLSSAVFLPLSASAVRPPLSVSEDPVAVCVGDGGGTYACSVYDTVLRLHVLADSDSDRDQAIKLEVRDAVLGLTSEILRDCKNLEDAEAVVITHRDDIVAAANAVLAKNGADYTASLSVGREVYPERDYGGQVYPAGEYSSVRVVLGSGEGHNWWCVLFPSLCLSPAVPDEKDEKDGKADGDAPSSATNSACDAVEVGLTPGEYRVITGTKNVKLRLRFRFLELIGEWLGR